MVCIKGSGAAYHVSMPLSGSPGIACHPPVPKQHPLQSCFDGEEGVGIGVGGSVLSCICPSLPVD